MTKTTTTEQLDDLGQQSIAALQLLVAAFDQQDKAQQGLLSAQYSGQQVYQSLSNVVLRIIFISYAEARGLLPVENQRYLRLYGLQSLLLELEATVDATSTAAYRRILALSDIMYAGCTHADLSMIAHKGQLFDPVSTPALHFGQPHKVAFSDTIILQVLQNLAYHRGQKICYKSLHVEQIGTIYEQLMELSVVNTHPGFVLQGGDERKSTGAHYTPRVLCDFTVQQAVDQVLPDKPTPEHILALRICDPAMGSGAFLAATCRYLALRLVEAWRRTDTIPEVALKEDAETFARHRVAEHCLYGVDVNPQAVELAKLSIWLESGARHRPFTFLDHALKAGNSIVGASPSQIAAFAFGTDTPNKKLQAFLQAAMRAAVRRKAVLSKEWVTVGGQQRSRHPAAPGLEYAWSLADGFIASKHRSYIGGRKGKAMPKKAASDFMACTQTSLMQALQESSTKQPIDMPSNVAELIAQLPYQPFHWELAFPKVLCAGSKGFDVVVGNPPFINCIRGNVSQAVKLHMRERFPLITGSADLSYYFLNLATNLIHKNGSVGFVLPRVSMGASALTSFRKNPKTPTPTLIYSANHYEFFANADIKVVVYILGQGKTCRVSEDDSPIDAHWDSIEMNFSHWWSAYQGNWWAKFKLARLAQNMPDTSRCQALARLGFEVTAGLTTDDFYKIHVVDAEHGSQLKLLTSGGVDPDVSYWGKVQTRFGGKKFLHPRIAEENYASNLKAKLKRSKRPKIIVASLTREVEAYFDVNGEYQASTATQTIFHESDDKTKLRKLCDLLHSPYSNQLFQVILGYNAMHSSISMEKSFLERFPVPENLI